MNDKTKSVDVLETMARAENAISPIRSILRDDVHEARTAVADLFEVAKNFALWSNQSPQRDKLRAALERCGVKS